MFITRTLSVCLLLLAYVAQAQLTPPGLDDTNNAFWTALGLSQKISTKWSSSSYIGEGRDSDPDNHRLLTRQAIFVLNEELQYNFNKFWATSMCISYRIQNRYEHVAPFDADEPAVKDETRFYSRLYARPSVGRSQLAFSFRPEYRTYRYHHHLWTPIDKEIRLRLKGQWAIPLNDDKTDQIIFADEVLFASDHMLSPTAERWTHMSYTENRIGTFYRHAFKHPSIVADFGVMQQVGADGDYIAHMAFDIILVDPFGTTGHAGQ